MIAEQTAVNTRTQNLVVNALINRQWLDAIGVGFGCLTRMLSASLNVAALPYATLWEASLIANLVNDPTRYEGEPEANDLPLLTNSWLHG